MSENKNELNRLRAEIAAVNTTLLEQMSRRAQLVQQVLKVKQASGWPLFSPEREQEMLDDLVKENQGPFSDEAIREIFQRIFAASLRLMEGERDRELRVSRAHRTEDKEIQVRGRTIGREPILIAGPCSVETPEQMELVASHLVSRGIGFMRGGAYKPRSSPYTFQGLGEDGLKILSEVGRRHDLITVSEVLDTRAVELVSAHVDILQIGSRSMYNYQLLQEVGLTDKPVLLKRGLSATVDELLFAAEYIAARGNDRIILCERGIRTFENQTRNTLDIAAVPLLRQLTYLPVVVDVSHAAGRRDILAALGRAALAAGANGLMVEVHPSPWQARSDGNQQLDLPAFDRFLAETGFAP